MPANPCGFAYANMSGCAPYARPGGLLVAGRAETHWSNPAWQPIRAAGCKVLGYVGVVERPDVADGAIDLAFYMGDISKVPLWPYGPPGGYRNWSTTRLTDIRPGSAWSNYAFGKVEAMMASKKVDGVFLDVLGGRLWEGPAGLSQWSLWTQAQRDEWTRGNVDFVRRLSVARDAINPNFIILNNNVWDGNGAIGLAGEKYVDGICLENHSPTSPYHVGVVKRPFSGKNRCVIAISQYAVEWSKIDGVTYVCNQSRATVPTGSVYATPTPPPVPFVAPVTLSPTELELQRQVVQITGELNTLKAKVAELQTEVTGALSREAEALRLMGEAASLLSPP